MALINRVLPAIILVINLPLSFSVAADQTASKRFQKSVQPVLVKHCYRCHGKTKAEANLVIHQLGTDFLNATDAETWHDVLNRLNLGEMPPEDELQPTSAEREAVVKWITDELKKATAIKKSTGGKVVMRRLTRYEYANTMRDLLGVNLDFAADLPPESTSIDGFRNNGAVLAMSPIQLEYYLKAARRGLEMAIVTGEKPQLYSHHADKSAPAKKKRSKAVVGNRMPPGGLFVARLEEFPREGDFVIRVKARATIPDHEGLPQLSVAIGVRADVQSPSKTVDVTDVDAIGDDYHTYEFRGRIEDYPLPGKNPKYPGLLITLTHVGDAPAKPKRKKDAKKQPTEAPVENPNLPLIEIESVDFAGPVFDAWPPATHTRIFFPSSHTNDETRYGREVLHRFMERAFRRPVTQTEVDKMMPVFVKIRDRSESFESAMRDVLSTVLISPDFLYLMEPRDPLSKANNKKQPLTEYELASRLSYFLWSTMPDEQLLSLAKRGELSQPNTLKSQVRRMIADERSWTFIRQFSNQWFDLSGLDRVAVNPEFYPGFDDQLKHDMRRETEHFFGEILNKDLSALNLIDSDFVMVNRPLAKHYGLTGPRGSSFERVSVGPADHRGGLLTQASILLANSTGEDSHPIRRAVWILDRLLDDPPPPPPPDVPELNSEAPDFASLPLKKQLELHRKKEACNSCHRGIDPWGVPLENFDAVGRWRTEVSKPTRKKRQFTTTPVDANSQLPGDHQIDGIESLKHHLLEHEQDRFSRAVTKKLMSYALGRSVEFTDRDTIEQLSRRFENSGYRLANLITGIVQSEEFQSK